MHTKSSTRWWRRLLSLVGVGYCVLVGWFSYLSVFYEVSITNKIAFCLVLCVVSFVSLTTMLYSRFQILTRLVGVLLLPAAFPLILLCFGEWEFILPITITALIIFFLSGSGEKTKTVFGVIYLLLYLLGSLAYFMLISLFVTSSQQTLLEVGTSPSGAYRYEILQIEDSSGGDIEVHVEPNDRDIELPLITFIAVGYDRTVYQERPASTDDILAEWSTVSRSEITAQILAISENVEVSLSDSQKKAIGISTDTETVYLKDISDQQLAQLGVPEENDVLTFQGKVCFRAYTAILEDYFALENREITLFE